MFTRLFDDDLYFIRSTLSEEEKMKKTLIAGATGLVGTKLVKALEAKSDPLIVLARRSIPGLSPNSKWIKIDFDDLVASESLPPASMSISVLGQP